MTDNLTGLQWETKQSLDSVQNVAYPHDADNIYTWNATLPYTAADGTVFTTFLPALNSGKGGAHKCNPLTRSAPV